MQQKDIDKIKQIAKDVYRSMGTGYQEVVYDKSMQVGLRLAGFKYEGQKVVELKYKDHYVGEGYIDLIVSKGRDKAVLELKATGGDTGASEETQLKNYLKLLKIKQGLLINFQQPGKKDDKIHLEIKELHI